MEISKIDGGAWLTLRPVDERVGEIKLLLRPVPPDFQFPEKATAEEHIALIGGFIIDWNLEDSGVAVPCNDDMKRRYLWHLIRLEVHTDDGKTETLAGPIASFVVDINNFLGN